MSLDDLRAIASVDRHDTRGVLGDFPEQCRRGRALRAAPAPSGGRPRLVVVAGMGGSASGGDMVAACASETLDVPILVHRGYGLPAAAGRDTLVVAVSYSGETVEVLSAAEAALARRVPLVAVTAGGALGRLTGSRGLPRVTLPSGLMPRLALGYLVFPLLAVAGAVPEMNHNEIEAWGGPAARGRHVVLLRDEGEAPEIARRFELVRELVSPAAGGVSETWTRGRGRLARILSLAYASLWTSFYLSVLNGVDPWPVPMLDEVKRRLPLP